MPNIKLIVHEYLVQEYGGDYKNCIFESVNTYLDDVHCGGTMIEATDLEGDVLRFWLQKV
jgi:hypothetical protein